jgi:hypothetical protein
MFQQGNLYTREQISKVVGGSRQAYLPTKGGQVVAICLIPNYNPCAPDEILPGVGRIVEHSADLLVAQQNALPTFLKRNNKEWEYVGIYRAVGCTTVAAILHQKSIEVGHRVTRVIKLEPA